MSDLFHDDRLALNAELDAIIAGPLSPVASNFPESGFAPLT
ncbi:MAG: hypothetical protein AB7U20_04340 [Planctomycetaceae bacterium]